MRNPLKDMPQWIKVTFWGTVIIFLAAIIIPASLQAAVAGLRGDYNNDEKRINPTNCEFVLTPERDETFLRCPVPEGVRIPNWPDHQAPLNKDGTR